MRRPQPIVLLVVLVVILGVVALAFIVVGLITQRQLLTLGLLPMLGLVIAHNASGLFFGWITATVMRVGERDRRAVMIEGGMDHILTFNVDDFRCYPDITAVSLMAFRCRARRTPATHEGRTSFGPRGAKRRHTVPYGATRGGKFLNHFKRLFGFKSPLSHSTTQQQRGFS